MKSSKFQSGLYFVVISLFFAASGLYANEHEEILKKAESRLRGLYDRNEFRPDRFRGQWLEDSSGYTVTETDEDNKQVKVRYDAADGKRTVVKDEDSKDKSGNISPDGKYEIYSEKGNLYVRDLSSKETTALTGAEEDGPVSYRGAKWSSDGKKIVFVESDYSKVEKRSMLIHKDPSYPEVKEVRFARVGGTIPTLRVGVVDYNGEQIRWLSIPEPAEGFYLGQVSWAENSHEVLVEKRSRFRDQRQFLLADIRNGAVKEIFSEYDPAWVIASYRKNAGIDWIQDGRAFVVVSEKDGWRHAYVYSRDGEELYLLTPGEYDIIEKSVIDEEGGWYYFYASPDNGTQRYLYRVKLDGSSEPVMVAPDSQEGTHSYEFSPDKKWAFHTYSSFEIPPVTELVRMSDHKRTRLLEDNKQLVEKMETFGTMATEFFEIEIDGGINMDAFMIKPDGFDASKKYPVFIYVYGEPHGQTVLDKWGGHMHMFHRIVSEMGYLVVSMDNRGTPAPKGAAWRRSIFGSLGPLSTREQAAGIQQLGRMRSYVDLSRVGIWGWSGGGSNTLNAMFRKPDVYNLGIAVAPKPQPHLYNAWFQEIYMETPETNPEGYRKSAPINFAEGLKGNLLIVHGSGETNTHIEITEGLVDKLIELGKQFDYMVYPDRNHGIRKGKGTSVHLRMLISRYLTDHLQPGPK